MPEPDKSPVLADKIETLVTASEAYPRLESLFLGAQSTIQMGFRLFEPRTKLQGEGQQVGKTWVDLFVHTLNRGVPIDLTISDFDPVMAYEMHLQAWQFVAISHGINELTVPGAARLTVRCILHPAEGGLAPRLMFWPRTRRAMQQVIATINAHADPECLLRASPRLFELLQIDGGIVSARSHALPRLYPVTLHYKMAVFDGQVTYVGGLDLNNRRYDTPQHERPSQDTWHDVQLVIRDARIAQDASAFIHAVPDAVLGRIPLPATTSAFRATLSRKRRHNMFSLAPVTICSGLLSAHLEQIRTARRFIYIENQFFRDKRIAAALAEAAQRNKQLCVILLLPAAPEKIAFDDGPGLDVRYGEHLQVRSIRTVRRAFGDRFLVVSPVQPRRPDSNDSAAERATLASAPIIYVHAKVSIFDDSCAIVASANLNGRSMSWDAETGVVLTDPEAVKAIRAKLFRNWMLDDADPAFFAVNTAFAAWSGRALDNAGLPPESRVGFIVPYALQPAAKIGVPIPGAPEAMV